jgi:invasion protein IalB
MTIALTLLALLAVQTPTPSGSAAPFTSTSWRVDCAPAGSALDCQAVERIIDARSGQTLVSMQVRHAHDAALPVIVVTVPLGVATERPIIVTFEHATHSYAIQTCTRDGCLGGGQIDAATLAQMRSAKSATISFSNLAKQSVTVTLPLNGFAAAYAKMIR